MGKDFFTYLPSEIILNILSRLPARTTMRCKCVCKPWLDLLTTPEFVKSHLSKSVPGLLAIFVGASNPKPYKIVEFVDELDLNCHEHRWNFTFSFDLPCHEPMLCSANGVLFLGNRDFCRNLFLCNLITRDYIMFPPPPPPPLPSEHLFRSRHHGFGVSRISGQYKVVVIFIDREQAYTARIKHDRFDCQVYTLGTGSWRRISYDSPPTLRYKYNRMGAFLSGNLHWLANDSGRISCLDLETEIFSTFSSPLDVLHKLRKLSVLGDCLCVCDNSFREWSADYDIDIWLMKVYGDEKSWTKEFVIRKVAVDDFLGFIWPIKVFKDGDIFMIFEEGDLLYYSSETKTIRKIEVSRFHRDVFSYSTIYTPSFLSLKTFATENVISF